MSIIRYVIRRRVGGAGDAKAFDEFLQDDGDFGPLTDHQLGDRYRNRRDMTRIFPEEVHAQAFIKAWEHRHPATASFMKLEIKRLP